MMQERLELGIERIREIREEKKLSEALQDYFERTGDFLLQMEETRSFIAEGGLQKASEEELAERNRALYEDILPEHYEESYGNPAFAVKRLGRDKGQLLSALYAELRSLIVYAYEQDLESFVIRLELFLEIYGAFLNAAEEEKEPEFTELKEIYYWFASDYAEDILEKAVKAQFDPTGNWAGGLLDSVDLSDLRYLYYFGEYITENERKLAEYMNGLPEETIKLMADTYTEGYRIGFEVTRKDISIKKTVNIVYVLGMERMVKAAMENFRKLGLDPIVYRAPASFLGGRRLYKSGYTGAIAGKQFEYDHEQDKALYLNSRYIHRKLEAYKTALEKYKTETGVMGGPAVIEDFGATPFSPQPKKENLKLDDHKQQLSVEYQSKARALLNEYVKGEERSFTIIAFPSPAIGEKFEAVFDETIKLNTLDYELYKRCQQAIIDVLDKADYVEVIGAGENRTNLKVSLPPLQNPEKETNFENCVADVNIPVGEVFTSPKLMGTNGILHVTRVFLHGLEYKDLELKFEDGMITDYHCKNFPEEAENKKYIKENLLNNHDTLPMGEFAIGTNTTAYVAAKRLEIQDVLPILIAEKTGPHFAVGDTCYSMEEEVESFNPDGKRIAAKENEISAKRHEDMTKAYFNCHTDITIPYDELASLTAVDRDRNRYPVIEKGRFVVRNSEELNKPFDE